MGFLAFFSVSTAALGAVVVGWVALSIAGIVCLCVAVAMVFEINRCINEKKNKRIRFLRDPPIYNPQETQKKNFQSPSAQQFFIISNSIRWYIINHLICLFGHVYLSFCSFWHGCYVCWFLNIQTYRGGKIDTTECKEKPWKGDHRHVVLCCLVVMARSGDGKQMKSRLEYTLDIACSIYK